MSVDMLLNNQHPELLALYKHAINSIDLHKITICISRYLRLDTQTVQEAINNLLIFAGPDTYISSEKLHNNLVEYIKHSRGINVDPTKSQEILSKAREIMKDKYKDYLDNAIKNMQMDFKSYLK